jgi:hypothetical protein
VSLYVIVAVGGILSDSLPVYAQTASLQQISIKTPSYRPSFDLFQPREGRYQYEVSWQGIPAAEASITVTREGGTLRVTSEAKTYSAIDLLYRLRFHGESVLGLSSYRPSSYLVEQQENSKKKVVNVSFFPGGEVRATRTQSGKEAVYDQFTTTNSVLDPVSASFLARSQPWRVGDAKEFDVFNGKSRYLITLTAKELRTMDVAGVQREVFVIVPKVVNLVNPAQGKKLREARIFVTNDAARDIVLIESDVFIGTVKTRMTSMDLAPLTTELQTAATLKKGEKAAS